MELIINGTTERLESQNLKEAVAELGFDTSNVVIAINATFVPRQQWESVSLNPHDRLEILSAIEGG